MKDKMKWLGLGALVMLWIALFYVLVIDVPQPEEVPLKYQSGKAIARTSVAAPDEVWEVHSLRAQARQLPETPKRNIFMDVSSPVDPQATLDARQKQRYKPAAAAAAAGVTPPPLPVPSPPTPEELAQQQEERAAHAARQQEELRRQQLQQQMGQYRYLGYVNQNGVQKAFLGKDREIYILREGDSLDAFMVVSIEPTTVKIMDSTLKLEVSLKLKKDEGGNAGI